MSEPRIALRPDGSEHDPRPSDDLDDVYVRDVSMFRAELMTDDWLWMCCYLNGEDDGNRIAFAVRAVKVKGQKKPRIQFTVTEYPRGVTYERRGLAPPPAAPVDLGASGE